MNPNLDLAIKNVRVVRPKRTAVDLLDIGVKDGKIARLAPDIPAADAREVVDGKNRLAFPGCVDSHMHIGIYQPLAQDAVTESKAAATGGVTSSLNYVRTGAYYLNRGGPYREFMPEALRLSEGNFWVDYGFHIAPIESAHLAEMEALATEWGVPSFKIFMFYGGYGLHGKSDSQNQFLMIPPEDRYDIAHFEFIMRSARRIMDAHPELARHVSVSLHCELAEILNAYTKIVEREGKLDGLRAYSAARPPHSEGLAIWIAAYLAHETQCPNINLLHLSSRKAMDAARMMRDVFPHVDFRREVTVGHLLLDVDCECAVHAKVNPPIRPREDVEALWEAVLARDVDWIVSDHACCSAEQKWSPLAREVGLRRHRVPALGRALRRLEARDVVQPHGGALELESGAALRAARQGRSRAGVRRRHRARRPARALRRARGRLRVAAGLHAVRGPGAHRPRQDDVPARAAGLRRGPDRR